MEILCSLRPKNQRSRRQADQVPQTILNVSSQSRTNYKQNFKCSFRLLLVELLYNSHSIFFIPMRFSAPPFGLTASLKKYKSKGGDKYKVSGEDSLWI